MFKRKLTSFSGSSGPLVGKPSHLETSDAADHTSQLVGSDCCWSTIWRCCWCSAAERESSQDLPEMDSRMAAEYSVSASWASYDESHECWRCGLLEDWAWSSEDFSWLRILTADLKRNGPKFCICACCRDGVKALTVDSMILRSWWGWGWRCSRVVYKIISKQINKLFGNPQKCFLPVVIHVWINVN